MALVSWAAMAGAPLVDAAVEVVVVAVTAVVDCAALLGTSTNRAGRRRAASAIGTPKASSVAVEPKRVGGVGVSVRWMSALNMKPGRHRFSNPTPVPVRSLLL